MLITLEGIEASGKTTLLSGLAARLSGVGREPLVTREPGGTLVGDRLRALFLSTENPLEPMTELFVICAARAEHVSRVIAPALDAGRIVLCDRFGDATRAYQGNGRGLASEVVQTCCAYAARGVSADLTLLVDVPIGVSRERIVARNGGVRDRLEREGDAFHQRVRDGYLAIARSEPARVKIVDGQGAPEAVLEAAWAHVAALVDRA